MASAATSCSSDYPPHYRYLLRDGDSRFADLRLGVPAAQPARIWRARRAVPGRGSARASGVRARGRSLAALQRGGRGGLRALRRLQTGVAATGSVWTALATVVILDRPRQGRAFAPRDALISLSSPRASLATAFGVHRALDTVGALLGPLLAFGLLTLVPGAFDAVFVVSFCAAVVGLGVLLLFVENRVRGTHPPRTRRRCAQPWAYWPRRASGRSSGGRRRARSRDDQRQLRLSSLAATAQLRGGFLPAALCRHRAGVLVLLAVPAGRLADQAGRGRVFVGGYALLLGVSPCC